MLIPNSHGQVVVAINMSSANKDNELVAISKKNYGRIVLGNKKFPAQQSHLLSHFPSLATIADGTPLAKAFVDAHNALRTLHGAPPVVWDNALAEGAGSYAAACVKGHATLPNDIGENLYYSASSTKISMDPAPSKTAVDDWYEKEPDWDYATSAPKGTGITGHFTQVVWKSTAKIGCGISSCPNIKIGGKTWPDLVYVVCRYTPSGNWDGQYAASVPKKK